MQSITRRNALTTVAALAAVPAVPVTALAMTADQPDTELRRLWAQYLDQLRIERACYAAHKPVYEAFTAKAVERDPGEPWGLRWKQDELEQLRQSFGLDPYMIPGTMLLSL
jgi:hypothetical protein